MFLVQLLADEEHDISACIAYAHAVSANDRIDAVRVYGQ